MHRFYGDPVIVKRAVYSTGRAAYASCPPPSSLLFCAVSLIRTGTKSPGTTGPSCGSHELLGSVCYWTVKVNVALAVVFWASLPLAVTVTVYVPAVVPGLP